MSLPSGSSSSQVQSRPITPFCLTLWGSDADEVTFAEFNNGQCQLKKEFNKIVHLCEEATRRGIEYVWIDTCCIDKSSSAELSEAINSVFRWYEKAKVCFVHLEDYDSKHREDGPNEWDACKWYDSPC